jgi:hypothetical protein
MMGNYEHHAIVVTVYGYAAARRDEDGPATGARDERGALARHLRDFAEAAAPGRVTALLPGMNDFWSFAVLPDGSKAGWPESEAGDMARDRIVEELERWRYNDGSTPVRWVEVMFGATDEESAVTRDDKSEAPEKEDDSDKDPS